MVVDHPRAVQNIYHGRLCLPQVVFSRPRSCAGYRSRGLWMSRKEPLCWIWLLVGLQVWVQLLSCKTSIPIFRCLSNQWVGVWWGKCENTRSTGTVFFRGKAKVFFVYTCPCPWRAPYRISCDMIPGIPVPCCSTWKDTPGSTAAATTTTAVCLKSPRKRALLLLCTRRAEWRAQESCSLASVNVNQGKFAVCRGVIVHSPEMLRCLAFVAAVFVCVCDVAPTWVLTTAAVFNFVIIVITINIKVDTAVVQPRSLHMWMSAIVLVPGTWDTTTSI